MSTILVAGKSLREYADQAHLTVETVRSTLKAVFHKTDTHNQAGLVRKLLLEAVESVCQLEAGARVSGELAGFHEHGIPAERGEVYAKHYIYNDPRIEYAVQHRKKRTICDYDFITESQMDRHEYYAEFLAEGDFRYVAGVQLMELEAQGEFRSFTIQRSPREGHPTPVQVELLGRLAPPGYRGPRMRRRWRRGLAQ